MNMVLYTQTDTHLYMCSTFSFLKDSCWSLLLLFKTHIRITNFVNKTHKIVSSPMRFHDGAHSLCFCSFDINHSVSSSAAAVAVMCVSTTIPYTVVVIAVDFFFAIIANRLCSVKEIKKEEPWQHSVRWFVLAALFSFTIHFTSFTFPLSPIGFWSLKIMFYVFLKFALCRFSHKLLKSSHLLEVFEQLFDVSSAMQIKWHTRSLFVSVKHFVIFIVVDEWVDLQFKSKTDLKMGIN